MIFVGYELGSKGYKFWDKEKRTIVLSRDVTFNEKVFQNKEAPVKAPNRNVPPPPNGEIYIPEEHNHQPQAQPDEPDEEPERPESDAGSEPPHDNHDAGDAPPHEGPDAGNAPPQAHPHHPPPLRPNPFEYNPDHCHGVAHRSVSRDRILEKRDAITDWLNGPSTHLCTILMLDLMWIVVTHQKCLVART
ncbi:hypothetical protein BJ138DRAFT_1120618 [Hygrophoropsis aurantiaca]|uniref:Uncharacterized protein n=1 Tax=Hygrophoropsis aurantiaca TaxID=72124 RepID=A0ACB7ZQK0_9AGAM|nr:hypothetical protein BJ138DRAFT_1120618 [Hygrophoropsis aurantiaca]